jgi:hypothetical protein
MAIIVAKAMQFDFVDAEFRKLVTDACLAHWLVGRRGYGVPYPEVSQWLFSALAQEAEGEKLLFNAWIPDSPYNADILLPDQRVALLVLSRFGSHGKPVGVDLVQQRLIESLGWRVVAIDRRSLAVSRDKGLCPESLEEVKHSLRLVSNAALSSTSS